MQDAQLKKLPERDCKIVSKYVMLAYKFGLNFKVQGNNSMCVFVPKIVHNHIRANRTISSPKVYSILEKDFNALPVVCLAALLQYSSGGLCLEVIVLSCKKYSVSREGSPSVEDPHESQESCLISSQQSLLRTHLETHPLVAFVLK